MTNRIYILILTACLLLSAVSSAVAFKATFTPTITVDEEYTDNLFLSDNDKEHDYITTISPGFSFNLSGKNIGAGILYTPTYTVYDRFSENNTWRHSVELSGWADVSKNNRIDIHDSFFRTEEPLSEADITTLRLEEPTALIDNTIRRSRQTYYTNTSNIRLTHQLGRSDSIYLQYIHSILENDDPNIEDLSLIHI